MTNYYFSVESNKGVWVVSHRFTYRPEVCEFKTMAEVEEYCTTLAEQIFPHSDRVGQMDVIEIWSTGDPSVGIASEYAVIKMELHKYSGSALLETIAAILELYINLFETTLRFHINKVRLD